MEGASGTRKRTTRKLCKASRPQPAQATLSASKHPNHCMWPDRFSSFWGRWCGSCCWCAALWGWSSACATFPVCALFGFYTLITSLNCICLLEEYILKGGTRSFDFCWHIIRFSESSLLRVKSQSSLVVSSSCSFVLPFLFVVRVH